MRSSDPAETARRRHRALWRPRIAVAAVLLFLGSASGPAGFAEPYTPVSDDEVLERIPRGVRSADLRRDREELASDPENLRDSVSMAGSYLETARTEGDARFLGYAQAILGPWWNQATPPLDVRLIRATVFAATFEFDRALGELDAVLTSEPDHPGAWAARVEVCLARGDFEAARSALERARAGMSDGEWTVALARCARSAGELAAAVAGLEPFAAPAPAVDRGPDLDVDLRHAALAALAHLRLRQGRGGDAATCFAGLRGLGRRDVRLLGAEADFELDRDRAEAVVELLKGETAHDGLAVRLLEAWKRRNETEPAAVARFEELRRQVEKRLEDRRSRGDASSLPDEVRYWLRVRPDAGKAAERAGELWGVRRTLEDAALVIEAARFGGRTEPEAAVRSWAERQGVRDARLELTAGPGGAGEGPR